jgi:hypothetical protein
MIHSDIIQKTGATLQLYFVPIEMIKEQIPTRKILSHLLVVYLVLIFSFFVSIWTFIDFGNSCEIGSTKCLSSLHTSSKFRQEPFEWIANEMWKGKWSFYGSCLFVRQTINYHMLERKLSVWEMCIQSSMNFSFSYRRQKEAFSTLD